MVRLIDIGHGWDHAIEDLGGLDVHNFGSAMLAGMAKAPPPEAEEPRDDRPIRERFAGFITTAEASQKGAAPGEFVFEAEKYPDRIQVVKE